MTTRNWRKSNSFLDCLKAGYENFKAIHGDDEGAAADVLANVFHHTRWPGGADTTPPGI